MKLGAHVSIAKPFSDAPLRAAEIGCECMQIFVNPPQRWNPITIPEEEIVRFVNSKKENNIDPIVIHSIYLVNFASSNPFFYEQSIKSLVDDMQKAKMLGAIGANAHLGSTKGTDWHECLPKVTEAIKRILGETEDADFIIENAAGAGNIIGDTIEEIVEIIHSVNSSRVKVLIDTAHAFESGYDLRTAENVEDFVRRFNELIGLDRLVGFHLNDSKTELNSRRDRHADIGKGLIGLEGFRALLNHPELTDKFGILETPQDELSWQYQIEQLKTLRQKQT